METSLQTQGSRFEQVEPSIGTNDSSLILVFGRQAFASQAFSQMLSEAFPDRKVICANSRERLAGIPVETLGLIVVTTSAASNQKDLDTMSDFLATESARPFTVILGDVGLGVNPAQAALLNLRGAFPDETSPDVVLAGLRFVLAGGRYFPKDENISQDNRRPNAQTMNSRRAYRDTTILFTSRELSVLEMLAKGLSNKSIARELFIAENTIKIHVRSILRKLEVKNRTEAALLAQRLKLIGIS